MNVFELFAKLSLDSSEYEKGLTDAESKASKLGSGLATASKIGAGAVMAMGTAVVGAGKSLVDGTNQVAQYGDNIDKMSQKVGMSAEAYQEWDYVMKISGTEMSNMTTGLKTLTNKLDDAKGGSADAQEMFAKLGLSMDDINSMSREEAFDAVISGFQGMADSTERAGLANDLFGKSGQELAPLFNTSAEETQRLKEEVQALGGVMSDDAVKASANFQDQLTAMQTAFSGLSRNLLSEFLPGLTTVMDGLTEIFTGDYDEGLEKLSEGVESVVANLTEKLPQILEVGVNIIEAIAQGILDNIDTILPALVELVMDIGQMIIDNLPLILETGLQIIIQLAEGIIEALPELIPAIVEVIVQIVTLLTEPDTLIKLIEVAFQLMGALAEGILKAIPELVKALPQIILNIVQFFMEAGPEILASGLELFMQFITGFLSAMDEIFKAVGEIKDSFGEKFDEMKQDALDWGKDLIDNFIDGIKAKWEDLKATVSNMAQTVKDYIGFSEPKKGALSNFHTYAPDMMKLFAEGIKNNTDLITDQIDDSFDFGSAIADSANFGASGSLVTSSGSRGNAGSQTVILELDKVELGRVVYDLNNAESRRMGVKLAGGMA